MHVSALRRPVLPLALAAALLTALLVLVPALGAYAHDELVGSDPADGSTVEALPEELTLTFNAALIDSEGGTAVVVTDASGTSVTDGAPEIDGAILTQRLTADAATAGEYQVLWQVVSSDGHPTEGQFTFTVATGTAAEATSSPAPQETTTAPSPTETAADVGEPDMSAGFSLSVPWIVAGAVVLLIAVFLVGVLAVRRRRSSGSDSDSSAER